MIHSISADRPSFKTVTFNAGLNVILATRTKKSNKKDSANGLGKSTLINILHFCLGGDKVGALTRTALDNWTFTIKLDVCGRAYSVSRTVAKNAKIFVNGDCSDWPIPPNTSDDTQSFSIDMWKRVLGYMMYGIGADMNTEYAPTFRSLISYFVRKDADGGYGGEPFQHNSRQLTWDMQVNNAYLLGLDWRLASEMQHLRNRRNMLKVLKRKSIEDAMGDALGDEAELDAVRTRLADEIADEIKHMSSFKVHKEYQHLETDANEMTKNVHEMSNQNVNDRRLLDLYRASMTEETDADPAQVAEIYKKSGLLFPDEVVKRLDDVRQFHKSIVMNRRDYLSSEISRLEDAIQKRDKEIQKIGSKRTHIMNILKTHGALDEFLRIQENHQDRVAELKNVEHRLQILRDMDDEKNTLALDSTTLLQRMKSDLAERGMQRANATRAFNSYSKSLYSKPGTLSIGSTESGYKFGVQIERSDSHGYRNMKIFCYDLTLARLWALGKNSPGFLVHDSAMFADVDKRQVAHAIRLADAESREHRYQYICMMNHDSVPLEELGSDFNLDSHVSLRLTDATEDGSLLGMRF